MVTCIFIASQTKSWWTFVVMYDIGFPAGIGLCFWIPLFCSWEWFPEQKGLITGIILGAYGLTSFIFGFITTHIANPANIRPWIPKDGSGTTDHLFPTEVSQNVPHMLQICLICWAVLALLSVLTISRNPDYVKLHEDRQKKKTWDQMSNVTLDTEIEENED